MFLYQDDCFVKPGVAIFRYTGLLVAILAAILDFSNCPRVRRPHPPGNNNMDLTDIESEEKKTLSNGSRVTPLGSRTTITDSHSPLIIIANPYPHNLKSQIPII